MAFGRPGVPACPPRREDGAGHQDAAAASSKPLPVRSLTAHGYTTLAALTFRKYFAGGASYYGISDISALAKGTHKFEAHYLDWLIGDKMLYRARSPVFHAQRLSKPVIFFQGDKDPVVPPDQAERMVRALRRKKIPTGYLLFAAEGHGFKKQQIWNVPSMLSYISTLPRCFARNCYSDTHPGACFAPISDRLGRATSRLERAF